MTNRIETPLPIKTTEPPGNFYQYQYSYTDASHPGKYFTLRSYFPGEEVLLFRVKTLAVTILSIIAGTLCVIMWQFYQDLKK